MGRLMYQLFFMAIFCGIGLFSILTNKKDYKKSSDNPDTKNIIENEYGDYCKDCGATIKKKQKFCVNCGKKL